MQRKQFSEEQIIGILKEAEAGAAVTQLCWRHVTSSATYYALNAWYGRLEVSDAKRLRVLEDENARLKRLLADTLPHPRSCATTTAGLWLPFDERLGSHHNRRMTMKLSIDRNCE